MIGLLKNCESIGKQLMNNLIESDIAKIVAHDDSMMRALRIAAEFDLPDWWIGAGFLRNKIWDEMENVCGDNTDVDLVYFCANDVAPETDWKYDETLAKIAPEFDWEVRNQARMHYVNDLEQFTSTRDGIMHWTETATAIGVKLVNDELLFLFCYGTDDLLKLVARPTPISGGKNIEVFRNRMHKKQWQSRWPHLRIIEEEK